jgi:hypothetical protein
LFLEQLNREVAFGRREMRVQHWYALSGASVMPALGE